MPTYTATASNGYRVRAVVDLLEQQRNNNRSRVRSRMQIIAPNTRAFVARSTGRHRTGGTTRWSISGVQQTLNRNQTRTLHTDTRWWSHNSSGNRSVAFEARFETVQKGNSWSFPRLTASGTYRLPRITPPPPPPPPPDPHRGPRVRHGGSWRQTHAYVRHGGRWRRARPFVRHGGRWREAHR